MRPTAVLTPPASAFGTYDPAANGVVGGSTVDAGLGFVNSYSSENRRKPLEGENWQPVDAKKIASEINEVSTIRTGGGTRDGRSSGDGVEHRICDRTGTVLVAGVLSPSERTCGDWSGDERLVKLNAPSVRDEVVERSNGNWVSQLKRRHLERTVWC